jgi:hypothetical protein
VGGEGLDVGDGGNVARSVVEIVGVPSPLESPIARYVLFYQIKNLKKLNKIK